MTRVRAGLRRGSSLSRGTPTFALFRGKDTVGEKWEDV